MPGSAERFPDGAELMPGGAERFPDGAELMPGGAECFWGVTDKVQWVDE